MDITTCVGQLALQFTHSLVEGHLSDSETGHTPSAVKYQLLVTHHLI